MVFPGTLEERLACYWEDVEEAHEELLRNRNCAHSRRVILRISTVSLRCRRIARARRRYLNHEISAEQLRQAIAEIESQLAEDIAFLDTRLANELASALESFSVDMENLPWFYGVEDHI